MWGLTRQQLGDCKAGKPQGRPFVRPQLPKVGGALLVLPCPSGPKQLLRGHQGLAVTRRAVSGWVRGHILPMTLCP